MNIYFVWSGRSFTKRKLAGLIWRYLRKKKIPRHIKTKYQRNYKCFFSTQRSEKAFPELELKQDKLMESWKSSSADLFSYFLSCPRRKGKTQDQRKERWWVKRLQGRGGVTVFSPSSIQTCQLTAGRSTHVGDSCYKMQVLTVKL